MATKITNKQIKVISNVNFNNKEIENAIIDATKNNIKNVEGINKVDDVLVNGESVVTNKIADIEVPTKTSDIENDSGYITNAVDNLMYYPTTCVMEDADNNLQQQIDAITVASDVTDIVGTYQELLNYDTQHLKDNDIIKVLQDSTHDNASSYYRWNIHTQLFTYIGSEGPYYTKSESDDLFAPQTRTINGKSLQNNINLYGSDITICNINNTTIEEALQNNSALNEFVITQEIFDEYKNENDYADLVDIIDSEEITQNVINLNNFDFFLNNLTISNKDLIFKNGNIILDSNGVDGTCDKAITASGCNIEFKDCQISSINCIGNINALIDINNTNLIFNNVIADDINFSVTKTFIQTTNVCNIKINDSDIELLNNDNSQDEPQNKITFIKVLNDNSSISINNSIVKIDRPNNNLHLFEHKLISTVENVTVAIRIINSYLDIEDYGDMVHFGKEKILDINLDNTNIDIINSTLGKYCDVRIETKYPFTENETYQTDSYFIYFENKCTPEFDEEIFENVEVDASVFSEEANHEIEFYLFIYNGEDWELNGTVIDLVDYGITYTLNEGQSLVEGTEIGVDYIIPFQAYNVIKTFTATSSNINEYTQAIKEIVIDDTIPGIDEVNTDAGTFANKIISVLNENDVYFDEGSYNTEFSYNDNKWYLKLYTIIDDDGEINEDVIVENYEVDLIEWGIELTYLEGYSLIDGMKFTITTESYITPIGLNINNCSNSVLYQERQGAYNNPHLIEFFFNATSDTSVFGSASIITNEIHTDNINMSEDGYYFLPVHNENLESDNVKDAINELANKESSASSLFDIKTILTADAEANKGWACTCYDEPHKLNEEQVAGAYHEIENMLNQTVETKIELTNKTDVNMNVRNMFYADGWYYYVIGNGTNAVVKRSDNVNGENLEDVVNVGEELNPENNYSLIVCNCIERDDEIYFMFYFTDTSFGNDYTLLYDKDWNLVMKYISDENIMPYFYGSNAIFGKNDYSNKIFIPSIVYDYNDPEGSMGSIRLVVYDTNSGDYEVVLKGLSDSSFNYMSTQTSFYDNKIWISTSSQVISIDLDNNYNIFINTELIPSNPTGFTTGMTYVKSSIIDEEETIDTLYFIYSDTTNENSFFKILRYNDDNVWEEVYYDEGDANEYSYVTDVKDYNEKTIISTGNNIYISRNLNDIESLYQINNAGDLIINDNILSVKGTVNSDGYSYFNIEENKIEFTDNYNINGEDVDINYYKSGEYKICEAGQNNRDDGEDENDNKLQDVYEYLGYLPYFWIDIENLDIVLPRNSNRWTMMYVGNNYVEEEMPEGNYSAFATKPIKLTNITASNWIEDDTFEDYGYKCEIEYEGVNENMFAQVVFSIDEANSGNYASVCDTAENKVIIYSKVNDTIAIPTIVIMEA